MTITTPLMDDYFQVQIPKSLNLNRKIQLRRMLTKEKEFDLQDNAKGNMIVMAKGMGKISYRNEQEWSLYVLDFEHYKAQLNNSAILKEEGITRMCDYFIIDTETEICILNEISSAIDIENLDKPTENFRGGKSEKAQKQLLDSLKTIKKCVPLWQTLSSAKNRICLFSYRIAQDKNPLINNIRTAFNRPLQVETSISKERGVAYHNEDIEQLDFQYRRAEKTFKIS